MSTYGSSVIIMNHNTLLIQNGIFILLKLIPLTAAFLCSFTSEFIWYSPTKFRQYFMPHYFPC